MSQHMSYLAASVTSAEEAWKILIGCSVVTLREACVVLLNAVLVPIFSLLSIMEHSIIFSSSVLVFASRGLKACTNISKLVQRMHVPADTVSVFQSTSILCILAKVTSLLLGNLIPYR